MSREQNDHAETKSVLATFKRGTKDRPEELRVSVAEFNGRRYVDVRLFWQGGSGEFLPSKKGITLRRDDLESFVAALRSAWRELG